MYEKSFWEGKVFENTLKKKLNGHAGVDRDGIDIVCDIKIDAKAMGSLLRGYPKNENYRWVEIQNVGGQPGSLCKKADYMAFETKDYTIYVAREVLLQFVLKKLQEPRNKLHLDRQDIERAHIHRNVDSVCYRIYQRHGRKDQIVLVKMLDLCFLSDAITFKK